MSSSHNSSTNDSLADKDYKQLYFDIKHHPSDFDEINFKRLYESDKFYGAKGSDRRKRFQKHVSYIRTLPPSKQFSALCKYTTEKPASTESTTKTTDDEDYDDASEGTIDEDDELIQDVPEKKPTPAPKKSPSKQASSSKKASSLKSSSNPVPKSLPHPRSFEITPSNLFGQPISTGIMNFNSPSFTIPTAGETPFESIKQDSTINHPTMIQFDPNRSENHIIFCVVKVDNVSHNKGKHMAYHIRMAVSPFDRAEWSATLPDQLPFHPPSYVGRSVLIKGPSRDFWLTDVEDYHDTKNVCEATKSVHKVEHLAISKNPQRQYKYYLIVFPEGVVLNNHIFLNDSIKVKAKRRGYESEMEQKDGTMVTVCGATINWVIGQVGASRVEDEASDEEEDDFFRKKSKKSGNANGRSHANGNGIP